MHSTSSQVADQRKDLVVSKIETMLESMVDVLLEKEGELTITLRTRPSARPTSVPSATNTTPTRDICFPGKTPEEAWRFTVLIRILGFVHDALATNVIITKRDIYYRHPALFVKQAVVDKYVDDLAFTFGVPRLSLNVSAAAKGLFAGAISIKKANGFKVDGCSEREGLLVPKLDDTDTIDIDAVRWILVVEKEATFRSLATGRFWETLRHQGVMITAKGYPDLATRYLLRTISHPSARNNHHCPPVHVLVDFDPDGIDILSTYKHGSISLAHETAALKLPDVRWLGVKSSETLFTQDSEEAQQGQPSRSVHHGYGLLSLSRRDRTKATRMLARHTLAEDGPETEWRRETQVMLMLNVKAEIQILEQRTRGLAGWLEGRLR
ncbi:DNA topoisomerase IV, alpha subunit [Saccharata proteae CBS 121410]|uniref:DNA topoisomerase (ATP-hydrolyzing) n=1 Tax=Saccharata proteae CBS 121410 TaxID=1314787 RepID=A0A9P4LW19_9PEZI|nr:DNA topoisomerase IV, alpha subunit [Saccharata proteae CBS 121410]